MVAIGGAGMIFCMMYPLYELYREYREGPSS
jgi:hypothetical protein